MASDPKTNKYYVVVAREEYNEDSLKWEIVNDYDKEFYEREFYDKPSKEGITE